MKKYIFIIIILVFHGDARIVRILSLEEASEGFVGQLLEILLRVDSEVLTTLSHPGEGGQGGSREVQDPFSLHLPGKEGELPI